MKLSHLSREMAVAYLPWGGHNGQNVEFISSRTKILDARYKKDYKIIKKQLEYLATRVRKLQRLTKKFESFV